MPTIQLMLVLLLLAPRAAEAVVVRSVLDGASTTYDDASRVVITNPLYDGIVSETTQPVWQARSIAVRPAEFVDQRDLLLQIGFGEPMRNVARFAPQDAWIFSLELINLSTQQPIGEMDRAVTLEFEIPANESNLLGDRFALNYFDAAQDEWRPLATRLEACGDQLFCGKTTQFAALSVVPIAEPSTGLPALLAFLAVAARGLPRRRPGASRTR
jgi:hypothetical protein